MPNLQTCAARGREQMLAGQRSAQDLRAMLAEAKSMLVCCPCQISAGQKNLTYPSFLVGPQYAALYTAMRPCGFSAGDVGKLVYDLGVYGMAAEPQVYRANGQRFFTPEYFCPDASLGAAQPAATPCHGLGADGI